MQPLDLSPATVIVGLVIIALAVFAVRRMTKRGLCDCRDGECSREGCAGCGAVDKMVADMERAAEKR